VKRGYLVAGGDHDLGSPSAVVQAVRSISQNLGLHNGHQSVLLADGGVAGQPVGVLMDGLHNNQSFHTGHQNSHAWYCLQINMQAVPC
jgi:hypothetical protein